MMFPAWQALESVIASEDQPKASTSVGDRRIYVRRTSLMKTPPTGSTTRFSEGLRGHTMLDERGTERRDLSVAVKSDLTNRVGDGHSILNRAFFYRLGQGIDTRSSAPRKYNSPLALARWCGNE